MAPAPSGSAVPPFLHGAGGPVPGHPFQVAAPLARVVEERDDYLDGLAELIDWTAADGSVDPLRIHLTGISIGGYGSWALGALHLERFAAIVPVCGCGSPGFGFCRRVRALKEVPIWVFHGARDDVVPVEESLVLVDEPRKAGGNMRLSVYPDAGHDSWTRTSRDPELYRWLFGQRRPG